MPLDYRNPQDEGHDVTRRRSDFMSACIILGAAVLIVATIAAAALRLTNVVVLLAMAVAAMPLLYWLFETVLWRRRK